MLSLIEDYGSGREEGKVSQQVLLVFIFQNASCRIFRVPFIGMH